MKSHIGIITASNSLKNFQKVDAQMREQCDITYLPYSTTMELTNLYLENISKFDGVLFSGAFPYNYITENVCRITKPHQYLELKDRDFYRLIARLYAQNPQIDFNRVTFDAYHSEVVAGEYRQIFDDVFPEDRRPQIHTIMDNSFYSRNLHTLYASTMDAYREQWKSGKVDLFVTRLTNLADRLKAEGIPHILLKPCPATIMDYFNRLLSDIQTARVENILTACCVIQIAHENPSPEEFAVLEKNLEAFNSQQNMIFVLRRNGDLFDAVTSSAAVRELTSGYTTCLLTSSLFEALSFSTYIGWGIDFDLVNAHQKALRAIQESRRDPHRYTYMVNESDEMIGPLCGDRTISYQLRPSARTNRIAKILGIAPMNLEKLISLQKKKHMTEFSASDLVFYLDITPRSATRILQKLVQHGAAVQTDSLHFNGRGRPAAVYQIDLDRIRII